VTENPYPPTVPVPVAINRYRVLFGDGQTVDYLAHADHSGVRELMLEAHFGSHRVKGADHVQCIAGCVWVSQEYIYTPEEGHAENPSQARADGAEGSKPIDKARKAPSRRSRAME
jgi:hypothetical protein